MDPEFFVLTRCRLIEICFHYHKKTEMVPVCIAQNARRSSGGLLACRKRGVIASRCAHWRGNLPDFQTFLVDNRPFYALFWESPHQSADWFAMTCVILGFSDNLKPAGSSGGLLYYFLGLRILLSFRFRSRSSSLVMVTFRKLPAMLSRRRRVKLPTMSRMPPFRSNPAT